MYLTKVIIENVGSYQVIENTIYAIINGVQLIEIDNVFNRKTTELPQKSNEVLAKLGNHILITNDSNQGTLYDIGKNLEKVKDFGEITFANFNSKSQEALSRKRISFTPSVWNTSLFDLKAEKIKWTRPNIIGTFIGTDYIYQRSTIKNVHLLNKETGETIWTHTLPEKKWQTSSKEKFELSWERPLGLYNEILWVLVNSGTIYGLDIKTGRIVHVIAQPKVYPESHASNVFSDDYYVAAGENIQLVAQEGKLLGVAGDCYQEIDLNSPSPERKFFEIVDCTGDRRLNLAIPSNDWPLDNRYIYACESSRARLAVLERESRTIVWSYQLFNEDEGFISKMEIYQNKLLVLDNRKRLFILERI